MGRFVMNKNDFFRNIPKIDVLLEEERIKELIDSENRDFVVDIVRDKIEELRNLISSTDNVEAIEQGLKNIVPSIVEKITKTFDYNVKRVINGTGTILHTNLGRAVISEAVADRLKNIVTGYSNLEYDLEAGERGERYSHFEEILCKITGCEAAMAVNNNAAAVLLILSTMAKDKEVIVSRGELVEIGGSFRVPDVMAQSGGKLVEIGTTNKTHLRDYENAITDDTAAFLKVHTSNYKIVGFTESVSISQLKELSNKTNIPIIEDIGSGVFIDLSKYGLTYEPTVQDSLKQGADVVCFSGDKLLGGPQAGIIVGKKELIAKMKKNPLTRAIRIDKFTATALESIFYEYINEERAIKNIPVLNMITKKYEDVNKAANELLNKVSNLSHKADFQVEDCLSQIGGGSLPLERIKSSSLSIKPIEISTAELECRLRLQEKPIIVRVANDKVIIDLRTVLEGEIEEVANGIKLAFS